MAIKGSLKEASLADVCQLLAMGLKTGSLSVTDRSRFGQIYFEKGRITYATVVNRRDRIGDLLVADRAITPEQLQEALRQQSREPGKRLGEILVGRGLLSAERLGDYIRTQIEEAVYHLFTWSQGSFYFEVDQAPADSEYLVSISPDILLLEGARRVDEWSVIEKKIPSLDLIFEADRDRLHASDAELTPEQERILKLLDGANTVQDVADKSGLVEFDVGKALYGLLQAGFAHRVGKRTRETGGRARESDISEHANLGVAFYSAGMLEDAIREFRRVLELRPDDASAHAHLALLALRQGRSREAVQRFKKLLEDMGPRHSAFVNLACALKELGRPEDALLVLGEAESLRPASTAAPLLRAAIHAEAGEHDEAREQISVYRDRLAGQPPAAAYFHLSALCTALEGRLEEAARIIEEGIETHPDSAPLLLTAAAISERASRWADAEQLYRQAMEEDAELAQGHKGLGDLAYRRGAYDEAAEHYQRALSRSPELGGDVHAKLGNILYKRFDREKALEHWRRALELNPDNQVVRNNLEVVSSALRQ